MSETNGVTTLPAQSRNWVLFRLVVRWARPLLILSMYAILFLPWGNIAGTDFEYFGGTGGSPFYTGLDMWLALTPYTLFLCAVPLLTLLPTSILASLWPKWWLMLPYYASLLPWLLYISSSASPITAKYSGPLIGLPLAVAAVGIESVYLIREYSVNRAKVLRAKTLERKPDGYWQR